VGDDAVRVEVAHLRRIEAGLGRLEEDAQHVRARLDVARRLGRGRARRRDQRGAAEREAAPVDAAHRRFPGQARATAGGSPSSMST
jgi:hypothetical protein